MRHSPIWCGWRHLWKLSYFQNCFCLTFCLNFRHIFTIFASIPIKIVLQVAHASFDLQMLPITSVVNSSTEGSEPKRASVIELGAFKKAQPRQRPFFAVCTGPYNIEFRICICGQCGTESFVRQYTAKIVALKDTTFPILSEDDRAKAGQMDSIALAMHVMNAGVWVCSRQPNDRLGLSALHSALPKWLLHATSKVVYGLGRKIETPFSRLAYTKTEVGGKTLISRYPVCEAELPAF